MRNPTFSTFHKQEGMFGDVLSSSMIKKGEQNFLTVSSACESSSHDKHVKALT